MKFDYSENIKYNENGSINLNAVENLDLSDPELHITYYRLQV